MGGEKRLVLAGTLAGGTLKKFEKSARLGDASARDFALTAPITSPSIRPRDGRTSMHIRHHRPTTTSRANSGRGHLSWGDCAKRCRLFASAIHGGERREASRRNPRPGKRGCPGDATMCSPGKGDCRIPSGWKVVYPPRSEPSVASRRCWRANRVAKPNVCVYSHSLGPTLHLPTRRTVRPAAIDPITPRRLSRFVGHPGPLRFPNARALSLPGAPPTPNRVRRAVSIGRFAPVHTLVRFSDELGIGFPVSIGQSRSTRLELQENYLVRF